MPFCSRCGDICNKDERCAKCGGTAVGAQVKWPTENKRSDSWIRTYVQSPKSTPPKPSTPVSPSKTRNRPSVFEQPQPQPSAVPKEWQRNESCPASPLLETADGTLTKLVGSVLSPESPTTHPVCLSCSTPFAPNSTLYIHPHDDIGGEQSRAFCYHCYVANFSKGDCKVCHKAVIGELKVEGVFINTKCGIFHSNCFNCDGCGVSLKDDPLTDLEGWPCCIDCFEGSAYRAQIRRSKSGRRQSRQMAKKPSMDTALRDLNMRLGLPNNTSPRRSGRISMLGEQLSGVELNDALNTSPKQRESLANLADVARERSFEFEERKSKSDKGERRLSARDLVGGRSFEGVTKFASPPPSPPKRSSRRSSKHSVESFPRPSDVRSRSQSISSFHEEISGGRGARGGSVNKENEAEDVCKECKRTIKAALPGDYVHMVRVPGEGSFHATCLVCGVCSKALAGGGSDEKLSVVKLQNGQLSHTECAPAQTTWTYRSTGEAAPQVKTPEHSRNLSNSPQRSPDRASYSPGLRNVYNTPPKLNKALHATLTPSPSTLNVRGAGGTGGSASPPKPSSFSPHVSQISPKKSLWATRSSPFSQSHFGGMSSCPSCGDKLTLFECTPGPAGTKYHKKCLRCKGCAKELDSFAKVDFDGWVWCRGCFVSVFGVGSMNSS
ncbi:hypothetical protein E3P99_01463 [Wallemia hederae]|uniref:LIM zinc-binding domain-containing protein n=1 Tax=Wallemia hederae TaxID=1540922 RepID=A0A4T0FQE1_9BASI|nr:hypothetical protein E3P99_01463 [Wallemia hederae]